jgi:hypothetical protein
MSPSGIEPATFRLVAQFLNQQLHRLPLFIVRKIWNINKQVNCINKQVNCTLEHPLRVQKGSRGISLLFIWPRHWMGCMDNAAPRPLYPREIDTVPSVQETGWASVPVWTGAKYLASTGIRSLLLDCVWNMTAHAQKPDFVFRRNWRDHWHRRGRQFSRLLAAEVCPWAVVMLDTPCSEVVWRVLATHSIRQFPLHFLSRASPCAITLQLDSTAGGREVTAWEASASLR